MASNGELGRFERILNEELQQAYAALMKAKKSAPSGFQHPDGTLRIKQPGDNQNRALDVYLAALKRFNDYAIRKKVPDDLKSL